MLQNIIVFMIVAAAVAFVVYSAVKRYRHRNDKQSGCGCGCSGCNRDCPVRH